MRQALLIGGVQHGPQMHGAALIVLSVIAVIAALAYRAKRRRESGRTGADRESANDRSADASNRSRDE